MASSRRSAGPHLHVRVRDLRAIIAEPVGSSGRPRAPYRPAWARMVRRPRRKRNPARDHGELLFLGGMGCGGPGDMPAGREIKIEGEQLGPPFCAPLSRMTIRSPLIGFSITRPDKPGATASDSGIAPPSLRSGWPVERAHRSGFWGEMTNPAVKAGLLMVPSLRRVGASPRWSAATRTPIRHSSIIFLPGGRRPGRTPPSGRRGPSRRRCPGAPARPPTSCAPHLVRGTRHDEGRAGPGQLLGFDPEERPQGARRPGGGRGRITDDRRQVSCSVRSRGIAPLPRGAGDRSPAPGPLHPRSGER